MDPITTAIVAAISAGLTEVGKEGFLDAYNALKSLLIRKFGSQSQVAKAVEDLEHNPSSKARAAVLEEEVAKVKADQDPQLRRAAYILSQQVNRSEVSRSNQVASGKKGVQQQAGQNAYHVSGKGSVASAGRDVIYGRTGLVVLMAIVLVAIFAILIWQLFPSAYRLVGATPTPTPTPLTVTPDGTLNLFCSLVRTAKTGDIYQDLYSANLKKQVTAAQFDQEWGGVYNVVTSCIPSINSSSGTTATGSLAVQKFLHNQVYSVTLIKEDGQWKIDSLQLQQQ